MLRDDPDGVYAFTRIDAVANLLGTYPAPSPEQGHGVPLTALLTEIRDNLRWAYPRIDAIANLQKKYAAGPEKDKEVPIVALLARVDENLTALAANPPGGMSAEQFADVKSAMLAQVPSKEELADALIARAAGK